MDVAAIPGVLALQPPAAVEAIRFAARQLPAELPEEYQSLLAQSDGVVADSLVLYSCGELPERNAAFGVGASAPGYVAVGDDNGGRAILLRGGRGQSPVFLVGHGSLHPDDMVQVAASLSEWVVAGCPLEAGS